MKKIFIVSVMMFLMLFFAGCEVNFDTSSGRIEKHQITSISVDKTDIKTNVLPDFDITQWMLIVNYDDNKQERIPISLDMISDSNYQALGHHELEINYLGFTDTIVYYVLNTFTINFYVDDSLYQSYQVIEGSSLEQIPTVPPKEGLIANWDTILGDHIMKDYDIHAIYAKETYNFDDVIAQLDNQYANLEIDSDISLVDNIDGVSITWQSSDEDILTSDGKFSRPYEATEINMKAILVAGDNLMQKDYIIKVKGYKSLAGGRIASNYLYRNYGLLTDDFFKTVDIVHCSFIRVSVDGAFTGLDASGNSIDSSVRNTVAKIQQYVQPKAKKQGIYIVPSLGGGGSDAARTFSIIASSDELRKAFAGNVVDLINRYGFDGIDIDWETPSTSEKQNFTLMMKELYTAIKANNPHHLVTAAIGGGKWQPPKYDLANSQNYLDYINVMTYSMTSNSGYYQNALYPSKTNHDQTNKCGRTLSSCSIQESITIYEQNSVPRSKLIFGLAFYGVRQTKDGTSWSSGSSIFYDSIKQLLAQDSYIYRYDEVAQVPYLISKDGTSFISYDDQRSIIAKAQYMIESGCAGLMCWETGCDTTGDLINAMWQGLKE